MSVLFNCLCVWMLLNVLEFFMFWFLFLSSITDRRITSTGSWPCTRPHVMGRGSGEVPIVWTTGGQQVKTVAALVWFVNMCTHKRNLLCESSQNVLDEGCGHGSLWKGSPAYCTWIVYLSELRCCISFCMSTAHLYCEKPQAHVHHCSSYILYDDCSSLSFGSWTTGHFVKPSTCSQLGTTPRQFT